MKFITIKSSHYASDLVVLQSKLESYGIKCYFKNEFSAQVLTHLPNALVELQIAESDFQKIQELIDENGEDFLS